MPRKPKSPLKPKSPPPDNPEQFKRFIEMAREVEADESPDAIDRAFKKVIPSVVQQTESRYKAREPEKTAEHPGRRAKKK